jgi:hypothetical protein
VSMYGNGGASHTVTSGCAVFGGPDVAPDIVDSTKVCVLQRCIELRLSGSEGKKETIGWFRSESLRH